MKATTPDARRRFAWGTIAKWVLGVAAVGFLGAALWRQWGEVEQAMSRLPVWGLVVSTAAGMAALVCSGFQQRSLLISLTSRPIPARQWQEVFLVAQLGKYVPGSGWAYVAQMEFSRKLGVRRATSVVVILVGAALTLLAAVVLGLSLFGQPVLAGIPVWVQIAVAALAVAALVVLLFWPGLIGRVLSWLPQRLTRSRIEQFRTEGPIWAAMAWTFLAWLAYALHFWLLLLPFVREPGTAFLLALGGFPLAWAAGFVVVVAPAGLGVREFVIATALAPVTGSGTAIALAAVSRFLIVVSEAALAAMAAGSRRLAARGETNDAT